MFPDCSRVTWWEAPPALLPTPDIKMHNPDFGRSLHAYLCSFSLHFHCLTYCNQKRWPVCYRLYWDLLCALVHSQFKKNKCSVPGNNGYSQFDWRRVPYMISDQAVNCDVKIFYTLLILIWLIYWLLGDILLLYQCIYQIFLVIQSVTYRSLFFTTVQLV